MNSKFELEPFPTEVDALLQAERQRPDISPEMAFRLDQNLQMAVEQASLIGSPRSASGRIMAKLAGMFFAGLLTGVAVAFPLVSTLQKNVEMAPPQSSFQSAEGPVSAPMPVAQPQAEADREQMRPSTLEHERRLLEQARVALGRGNPESAMEPLRRHERQFSAGLLREERESLKIQTLIALKDESGARRTAEKFFTKYPDSLFRVSIEASLKAFEKNREMNPTEF